jgi:UDP-N-acetylmuramoyl-tripeptide--D-alanyl-D-alanine ligase
MKSIFKKIVVSILTLEARVALVRHKPRIVAVTGNVGKTSTKDAVYAVMATGLAQGAVRKSEKSMNSEIGLPLAILGLENAWSSVSGWISNIWSGFKVALFAGNFPAWLVLEVGADHPGDIETISKWLHPDIVVLTRMSDIPVHVEYFASAADVLREKMFLAQAMKVGGTLVVNADDPHFMDAVKDMSVTKVLYGKTKGADIEMVEADAVYDMEALPLPVGQYGTMRIGKADIKITLTGVLGDHLMYPVAAACAVANILDIQTAVAPAFAGFESPRGRMRILKGLNNSAIIDDTYNSSPLACAEALKTVAKLSLKGKKIAVLGDMKELGANSEAAHRDIGKLAAETLHTLVVVGNMAKSIAAAAIEAGMTADKVLSFDSSEVAGTAVAEIVRAGDVVLVKGSQSMRMEKAVKILLAEPEKAGELLVRQEEEWGKR